VEGALRVEGLIREARATDANPGPAETVNTEGEDGEAPVAGGLEETQ
jgi:hypothetical protein